MIFISGAKDFYEDWKRKKSDDEENNKECLIFNKVSRSFNPHKWKDIQAGDIIKIRDNEGIPCDIALIYSNELNGVCYVETKNLDGETNLKSKQAKDKLNEYYKSEDDLSKLAGRIECKHPNEYIYEFEGNITLGSEDYLHIDHNTFLLRGCSLKRTKAIYGVAVYMGHETKIMKNSPSAKSKISRIEAKMNLMILTVFILQIILSVTGALIHLLWFHMKKVTLIFNRESKNYITSIRT